jgi:hypothetical protein
MAFITRDIATHATVRSQSQHFLAVAFPSLAESGENFGIVYV